MLEDHQPEGSDENFALVSGQTVNAGLDDLDRLGRVEPAVAAKTWRNLLSSEGVQEKPSGVEWTIPLGGGR